MFIHNIRKAVSSVPLFVSTKYVSFSRKPLRRVPIKVPKQGYLADTSVALSIRQILENQKLDLNATVIEVSPGVGRLTEQLFSLGFIHVSVFEPSSTLADQLQNEWPNLSVIKNSIFKLHDLYQLDNFPGRNQTEKVITSINASNNSEQLYFVGVIQSALGIHFIVNSFVKSELFHSELNPWKNITYYILVSSNIHATLTSTRHDTFYFYRPISIIFQNLFKYECLAEFPGQCIAGSKKAVTKDLTGRSRWFDFDPNIVYFSKITVNSEIVEQIGVDKLLQFSFFMKHNLRSRYNPIISQLEKWIPGCGPHLIRQGFTIYSQFGQLTPSQLLGLYQNFISLPSFDESSFQNAFCRYDEEVEEAEKPDCEHTLMVENFEEDYKLEEDSV